MARSKSSNSWLQRQFKDKYVKQSKQEGYRSRAAYKLLEINAKESLLKPNIIAVDLGSAPGGWSQVLSEKLGRKAKIIAIDILAMDSFSGVEFIQGDFTTDEAYELLLKKLSNNKVDLILSDMGPSITGNKTTDQARSMLLVELALDFALKNLKPNGSIVFKVFQGQGYKEWLNTVKQNFAQVKVRKPDSSRAKSAEVYVIAKDFKAIP